MDETDYVILKTTLSGFYQTPLEGMLRLRVRTLITGFAADNCVLFTAHDAYMREYRLAVPSDCIASESPTSNAWALRHMARFLKVDTRVGSRVDFRALKTSKRKR